MQRLNGRTAVVTGGATTTRRGALGAMAGALAGATWGGSAEADAAGPSPTDEYLLWSGNVRALPYEQRLAAAAAGGFDTLSIPPSDYDQARARGLSAADMLAMAADHGVRLTHLDPICAWVPDWHPQGASEHMLRFLGYDADAFFRIADALRVESATALGTFAIGAVPPDEVVERYAALCRRAAGHGVRIDLEFIMFWGIPDLATAWRIVREADQPNSGILLDLWHYFRGRPDDTLLATIPAERISSVQLTDGWARAQPGVDLLTETLFHRLPPGQGDFPITPTVRVLAETGALRRVGPEIFSRAFDAMDSPTAARASAAAVAAALDPAGVPHRVKA